MARRGRFVLIAAVLGGSQAASAGVLCAPTAKVEGEPTLVVAIEPILRERGIVVIAPTTSDAGFTTECRHVAAQVASGGGRIMVWLTDPDGRRVERLTEDPAAAATLIESWARRDLVDPLFAARSSIRVGPFEPPPSTPEATTIPRSRFTVLAGADAGVSGDGAVWSGFRAHACAAIGRVCLGGTLRYGIDLEQSGDSAAFDNGRTAFDVTITAELPLRYGRLTIAPGVGVGQTSVTAKRSLVDERELEQASAFHARAAVAAAVRLSGVWSLRIDLSLDVAPLARQRLGEPDGIDRQLAASPLLHGWLGLGIAYGVM